MRTASRRRHSYSYDGLSNLNNQISPDTGTTANTYDAAGNVLTQTDAKGQVTTYTYDSLNRVKTITYQGGVVHTYNYDQGTNQKGRLTQIVEPGGRTTTYAYNGQGRLISESRVINSVTYVTAYGYDNSGGLVQITYPSGRQINYTLDNLGRVEAISTLKSGIIQVLLGSVVYHPFGAVQQFSFQNNKIYARAIDLDGRASSYTLGSLTQVLDYDDASRITQIQDQGGGVTRGFGYDVLDRLTDATIPGNNQTYTYDSGGNRASRNGVSYSYFSNTNRLQSTGTVSYAYDNNGSATTAGSTTLTYDTRGRLSQVQTPTETLGYTVNALGQRVIKQSGATSTIFHYDKDGRLIAESDASGKVQREYVYLYNQLVNILVPRPGVQ